MSDGATGARPCDLSIDGATLVTLDGDEIIEAGYLAVSEGVIEAVGSSAELSTQFRSANRIDGQGMIVVPGFVDAHQHLGTRGMPPRPYEPATASGLLASPGAVENFAPLISRIGQMPVTPDAVYEGVSQLIQALIRAGFTGVVDAGGPQPEAVAQAIADSGIRGMVGPHLADYFPNQAGEAPVQQADPEQLLADARAFIEKHDRSGSGRVRAGVSAVWTITCSDELLRGLGEIARSLQVPVHIHTNVLDEEAGLHARWFEGRTMLERLEQTELLGEWLTLMHSGALSDDDVRLIADRGATVNHNALGNAMLGFGVAYHKSPTRLLAAGVPLVLGSDTPMEQLASPFDLMKGALAINREATQDDFGFTHEQALTAATNGGASLGRPGELGRLVPGRAADLVVIEPDAPFAAAPLHPVPAVVLNGHPGQVRHVVIDGVLRHSTAEGN